MKKNFSKFAAVNLLAVLMFLALGNSLFAQGYNFFTDDCSSNAASWSLGTWSGATNYPNGYPRREDWRYGSGNACGTTYMAINSYNNGGSYTCDYNEVDAAHDVNATRTVSTAGWESIYIYYDWTANLETCCDLGYIGYSTDGGTNYSEDAGKSGTAYGTWTTGVAYNISAITAANNNSGFKIRVRFHADASVGPVANSGFGVDNIKLYGTPITPAATTSASYACGTTTMSVTNSAPSSQTWYWQGTNSAGTSTASPTTSTYPVTSSGTYYIRAYAGGTWSVNSQAVSVTVYSNPTISNITPTAETSPCLNNGQIAITAATGFSPTTWQFTMNNGTNWTTAAATNPYTYTSVSAGTYSQIYVRYTIPSTATLCTSTAGSTTVTEPAAPTATATPTNVTCFGGNNGTINVTSPSGGSGSGYTAQISSNPGTWVSVPASPAFSGLSAAGYTVTIKDGLGCTTPLSTTTVGGPSAVVAVTVNTSADLTCYGDASGSVTLNTATGGSGSGYMYAKRLPAGSGTWSAWQSGTSFTGLAAGSYGFKAKDGNGCESSEITRNVTQPSDISATKTPTNPTCYGGANGSIQVNASGGTPSSGQYYYSKDGGSNYTAYQTNPYTFTNLSATTYNIWVKDSRGCTKNVGSSSLSNPNDITITSVTPTDVDCYGASNGSIAVSASGGTGTLTYSKDNGSNYQAGSTFTGVPYGTNYNIIVKDGNGCTKAYGSNPVTVNQLGQLNATVTSGNVSCNAGSDGTITISNESGGAGSYNYSINNGSSWELSGGYTGLTAGTYIVKLQDVDVPTCTRTISTTVITQPPASNGGSITGGTTPICYGSGTGTMTVGSYTGSIIKWQKKLGSGSWTDITNTNATYSETPSSAGTWYYHAVVRSGGASCATANSTDKVIVVNETVTATAGSAQNLTGTWAVTLAGNSPSYGTGTWTKESGSTSASYSPNANTYNAVATVGDYGAYTFRWTIVNGACSAYDEVNVTFSSDCAGGSSTFSGTGNWNDHTKWNHGVPTSCIDAYISGDVTLTANGECRKLIVNPGKSVTINSSMSLTVNDSVKLKSSAAGTAMLIDKGTFNYTASLSEIQLYIGGSTARDTLYHMYSAPVVTPSINAFWYFYMYHFDETIGDWVINYTNDQMQNGIGYAGFYTGNISSNPSIMVKYRGYNWITGTKTYNLSKTGPDAAHFNLIGNPYPSPVDLDNVTFTDCDAVVYFWNSSGEFAGNYGTYNLTTKAGDMDGGNILPAHNAFFVSATGSNPSVQFTNNSRVRSTHALYKSYNSISNHMKLIVSANDYKDALTVGFLSDATKEFDGSYDAHKLFGGYDLIPTIYAKTSDGIKVAVDELPQLVAGESTIVPVEFVMGANGTYSLKAEDINTFDNETSIYLEDKVSNSMINLRDVNTYSFNYNTGELADRFNLHFKKAANGINESSTDINIYSFGKSIYINSDNSVNGTVNVYDVLGQEVLAKKLDSKTINTINMNGSAKGYYMVKITTANNTITKKIYID